MKTKNILFLLYLLLIIQFVHNAKQADNTNVLMIQKSQIKLDDITKGNSS